MAESRIAELYSGSSALIIGIDTYSTAGPLKYAVSDATSVSQELVANFGFPEANVRLLLNEDATRSAISDAFLAFAGGTSTNDRVVIFFAGHGHTARGRRGEVGFLVPCDGDPGNLATLMRWDELTRNADLIEAKHVLFLMDACYGGLAITRALRPGSMRFLRDMLLRRARQVLTAGKADEVVADAGGPLPEHSVFTGHLLEGMRGGASDVDGSLTANGLMAYVYQRVSRDPDSQQTPHFGYLDGDGDLILAAPFLEDQDDQGETMDEDVLVSVPAVITEPGVLENMTTTDRAKEYLSEARYKMKLHDLVAQLVREALSVTTDDRFSGATAWSPEAFLERLEDYERIMDDLCRVQSLLGYWGEEPHAGALTLAPKRFSDQLAGASGTNLWLALNWYPVLLLLYSGGVAAVAGGRYGNLRRLLQAKLTDSRQVQDGETTLNLAVTSKMGELYDAFKHLPGRERNFTPRSEHLHKLMQPLLDDLLFLGTEYEFAFDRFELLYALQYGFQLSEDRGPMWFPIGRFGYKYRRGGESSPFHRLVAEVEREGDSWAPISQGMFGGDLPTLKELLDQLARNLANLGWH